MPGMGKIPMSHLTIPARPEAGAIARRVVSEWLSGHPRLDDALLALTELINNAVIHGALPEGETLTVGLEPDKQGVRLTVRHIGLPFDYRPPTVPSRDPGASRGLSIVSQIADRWGVDSDGHVVTAWFEVGPLLSDLNGG